LAYLSREGRHALRFNVHSICGAGGT
jgi:hypothetical protein